MPGNFFSGARKYLSGAISALASHLPLMANRGVLSNDVVGLTPRPLGVGERKPNEPVRFWWRDKWVTPATRHMIQNNKALMAQENRLLQALVKRNAYYHGV